MIRINQIKTKNTTKITHQTMGTNEILRKEKPSGIKSCKKNVGKFADSTIDLNKQDTYELEDELVFTWCKQTKKNKTERKVNESWGTPWTMAHCDICQSLYPETSRERRQLMNRQKTKK